jgi:hypothetical protein
LQAELRAAHESARAVSAAVSSLTGQSAGGDSSSSSDDASSVPEWKLREFEDLRNAVATMWEQLDVPPEDVTAFLSECDLLAPFSPAVLGMYQDMYRRLTNAASAAAVAATAPMLGNSGSNGVPQPLGYEGGVTDSSSSASSAALAAPQLAEAYEQASQAAAARAKALAQGLMTPVQGITMPQPSSSGSSAQRAGTSAGGNNGSVAALATVASQQASQSNAGAANAGFRTTLFSSSPAVGGVAKPSGNLSDDEIAYLNRLKSTQLPPSLGGPGARTANQRGGSIHVSAGGDMLRRSPSPNNAHARALAASINAGLGGGR